MLSIINCCCCYSARERNNAAFELVNLSVADDNSKFLIVQEDGYVHVLDHMISHDICSLQVIQTLLTSGEVMEVSYNHIHGIILYQPLEEVKDCLL